MKKGNKVSSIGKELISLATYPYDDASPIPEFGRLYSYHRFDGYTDTSHQQEWEMIVMENEFIKLWINPSVGGKIWGAVEKSTGKEFFYFNHSAKFRDVAMRGPWASGGMEFNIGIIGHSPSCSSPVDYSMHTNDDGSVTCFVGAADLPSSTNWTVEVNLPADCAYFITRTSLYNYSRLEQPYYQWNNVAIKTSGNLEYVFPGNKYLIHDGKYFNWPVDENGREITWYDKNDFGEYKSYHVIGSYADFWGCYWHDDNFGLGHSAAYDDKPGKKAWIWGLSRYGMIWEDLLTDADGQYSEVQSGKAFSQSISPSSKTPFKHNSFLPYAGNTCEEWWYPVKNIGGLTYGNALLSFYLSTKDGSKQLSICANQTLNHSLKVEQGDKIVVSQSLKLGAMQTTIIALPDFINPGQLKVWLNDDLIYNAEEQNQPLSRPLEIPKAFDFNSVQAIYVQAKEWERQRFYKRAIEDYKTCLKKDPFYIDALCGLAGIFIKQTNHTQALNLLKTALSVNTYHPEANYLYGIANGWLNNIPDAKDGFSIASQSITYSSAAYIELAKIFFKERQLNKSLSYIKKSLQYNRQNRQASILAVVISRIQGNINEAKQLAEALLITNPICHLTRFESYQLGVINAENFKAGINNDLTYQTYLDLNSFYFGLGLYDSCLAILDLAPSHPLISVWQAYLSGVQRSFSKSSQYIDTSTSQNPELVFPHRADDIMVLEWAIKNSPSWKFKYYLALGYIQILKTDEALKLLSGCENEPDFYAFYLVRANLQRNIDEAACEADLKTAVNKAPAQWRTALALSKFLEEKIRWPEALKVVETSYLQQLGNYYLGLQLAKCYMQSSCFSDGLALMKKLTVLPNEGASTGRNVWRDTNLFAALEAIDEEKYAQAFEYIIQSKQWPENLGVGKPYIVDERLENFLELHCLQQTGQNIPVELTENITLYRDKFPATPYSSNDFLSIYCLQQNNEFDKAQSLLNEWVKHDDSVAAQWAVAVFNGDTEKAAEMALIEPEKREPMPYEILFEDGSFAFIKGMYNKNFFKTNNKALI